MRINVFMDKIQSWGIRWLRSVMAHGLPAVKQSCPNVLIALFLAFSVASGSGCAWLDVKQRNLIYRPTPGVPADFAGLRAGDERYFVNIAPAKDTVTADAQAAAQRIEMWWLPHTDPSAPTLLYLHGTFRNLFQNQYKIEALRQAGFAVLAVEYRGWGLSTAITPSEQTIVQDADLAFEELRRREPRAAQRVIYGHSMGSAVAVDIASRLRAPTDYGAIILESALTSFSDVAGEASWLGRLFAGLNNERFASIEKIAKVQAPLLMLHGSADTTVPVRLGEKLFALANAPKQWLAVEGGSHSDLHQVGGAAYQNALLSFRKLYLLGR
jgi:uncharacterized protein